MAPKVFVVVPPFDYSYSFADSPKGDRLGVGYLTASLRQHGIETGVIHCPIQNLTAQTCAEELVRFEPELVAISTLFSDTDVGGAVALAREIKGRLPATHVSVGGHPVTFTAEEMLTCFPQIDSIARGEGDLTLLELAGRVLAGEPWHDIAGLVARENGHIICNPPRPLIEDLDRLPFAARDILDMLPPLKRYFTMLTSRGCYHRCSFCSIHSFYRLSPGRVWRGRSPENVADELEHLKRAWGPDFVQFIDENFIGPGRRGKERAYGIGRELIRRKIHLQLALECRADGVDEELFSFLKHVGLRTVFLGIDSGVQRVLDFFNKGTTVDENRRALDVLDRLGIQCRAGFINFDPFLTPQELGENIQFFRETGMLRQPGSFSHFFNRLQIYRGTPLEATLAEQGLLKPVEQRSLPGYTNKYTYDFVDRRTALLFDVTEAAYRRGMRSALFNSSDFERNWRSWYTDISRATGLPESCLDAVPELQGPFVKDVVPAWLQARNVAVFDAFETLVEQMCHIEPEQVSQDMLHSLSEQLWVSIEQVDRDYLGMSVEQKTQEMAALLATRQVHFAYEGRAYDVSF